MRCGLNINKAHNLLYLMCFFFPQAKNGCGFRLLASGSLKDTIHFDFL